MSKEGPIVAGGVGAGGATGGRRKRVGGWTRG